MCTGVWLSCVFVHQVCAYCLPRLEDVVSDFLELELQMGMSCHTGARN